MLSYSFTTASQILIVRLIILSINLLYEDGVSSILLSTSVKAESFLAKIRFGRLLSHLDESTSEGMIAVTLEDLLSRIGQFILSHLLLILYIKQKIVIKIT